MSVKAQYKAEKLVNGAVTVFADAIAQVEKANSILEQGIVSDNNKLEALNVVIDNARKQKAGIIGSKEEKEKTISKNIGLIIKLKEFAG